MKCCLVHDIGIKSNLSPILSILAFPSQLNCLYHLQLKTNSVYIRELHLIYYFIFVRIFQYIN